MFMFHLISTLDRQEDLYMFNLRMSVMLKMLYVIWTENGFVGVRLKYNIAIMIDIGILGAEIMKGGNQGVVLLITTIGALTVLETVDRLEDHGVAEAIPTMMDSITEIDLFQDLNPIQDHGPSPSPRKK
ncbi:hypothetical protein LEMLEM_LOCUS18972 [Lemmus lemmus]